MPDHLLDDCRLFDTFDPVNRAHPLARGLIGWWMVVPPLDGGQFWHDLTGLCPATLTGATWQRSPGRWGSLGFSGASSYAFNGNFKKLDGASGAALIVWFRNSTVQGSKYLVNCPQSAAIDSLALEITGSTRISAMCRAGGSTGSASITMSSTADKAWHMLAAVYTGSAVRAYLDGAFQAQQTGLSGTVNAALGEIDIARENSSDTVHLYTGQIDDVKVYNRSLSDNEIQELYFLGRIGYPRLLNRVGSPWSPAGGTSAVSAGYSIPAEWLASLQSSITLPAEWLAGVLAGIGMPCEWLAALVGAETIPVEFVGGVIAPNSIPAEWLASQIAAGTIPVEFCGTVLGGQTLPAEWTGGAVLPAAIPAEWLSSMFTNQTAIAEWLAGASGGAILAAEWLAAIQQLGIIPVEWEGVPGTPDAVWSVDPRGTVWIIDARGSVWSVAPRGTVWPARPI